MTQTDPRRVIPTGATRKEIFLAVLGAILAMGLVFYAVLNMGNDSARSAITGKVVEKKFVPREEVQITIGGQGVQRAEKAGQYYLRIKADDTAEVYSVLLSEEDYQRAQVGDSYQIPKASLDE